MKEHELINLIKEHPDWNFYALALTPWQALGIDACIESLNNKGIEVAGCVLITKHPITGACIDEKIFTNRNVCYKYIDKIELERSFIKLIKNYFFTILSVIFAPSGNIVYIAYFDEIIITWARLIKNALDKKVCYLCCDDGVGCYITFKNQNFAKDLVSANTFVACFHFIVSILAEIIHGLIIKILKKNKCFVNRCLLKKEQSHYVPNKKVIQSYRKILKEQRNRNAAESLDIADKIILCTQPLKHFGMTRNDEDMEVYDFFLKTMNEMGLIKYVVIKPHPREKDVERYQKYGCGILEGKPEAIESIISRSKGKPYMVVSTNSSSMISVKLLFDIETISLARFLLNTSLNKWVKKDVRKYIDAFGSIVKIPDTKQELKSLIDKELRIN